MKRIADQNVVWLWLLLAGALSVYAQDADRPTKTPSLPNPSTGRREYMGRKIAVTMHFDGAPWLVRESRQREEDCATLLQQLRIKPGMHVVDMGCGNGFYSFPLARLVGATGKVWAVDVQPEMLRLLEARAQQADIEQIELVLGRLDDPRLVANSADLILCVDVYHEFSHPEKMLAGMRRALKPNGQLVLAEFREEDPAVPIKPLHKMSKKQVLNELIPNGYRLVREFDGLPWQHLMFFERDVQAMSSGKSVPAGASR